MMSQYKTIIDTAIIYSETDALGTIVGVNDLFCTTSGYARDELIGRNHRVVKSDRHSPAFYGTIWATISSGTSWKGQVCNRRKDGRLYWVNCTISPVLVTGNSEGPQITNYISVSFDVTEYFHTIHALQWHASYDFLTGLPNRAMLNAHLSTTIASAARHNLQPFALGVLDVDNFKQINDSFGHEAGDWVLIEIARRLRSALREYDFIARLGGDEFVCVWSDVDIFTRFGLNAVATKEADNPEKATASGFLSKVFAPPYYIARGVPLLSVKGSLGVVLYPKHGDNPDTLLRRADEAMYRAKSRGGNCIQISQYGIQCEDKTEMEIEHSRSTKSHFLQ